MNTKPIPQLHACPQCHGVHSNAQDLFDCCIWQHVTAPERLQMQREVEAGQPLPLVLLNHGAQAGDAQGALA
ncbi:hypothetical protein HS961_07065 [Comamonas piscis]|uniref:Uncharacterized protein n=1 Tax=Comamonas piscis TaxID=1562974 RepID=A0A7G5EF43_9BURK|nr:hypothetical protein [Comamonas piscis]QMV72618.1 hypothetical protein HS961_07065 [Comamonas piscis]WSO35385.1 hypothetical protein VUJ63_07085 [Comamonas piscis]